MKKNYIKSVPTGKIFESANDALEYYDNGHSQKTIYCHIPVGRIAVCDDDDLPTYSEYSEGSWSEMSYKTLLLCAVNE